MSKDVSQATEQPLPELLDAFIQSFGESGHPIQAFFAPGRVNLIGEYTDFTGGLVFPCAIAQGTWLLIRRTHNHQYRFVSTNFDYTANPVSYTHLTLPTTPYV